jgi:hypothetical protein
MFNSAAGEVYHFDSTGENVRKFIPLDSYLPVSSLVDQDLKDLVHGKMTPHPCIQASRTE